MTLVTSLAIGLEVFAVDGFGKDACTSRFAHAPRTAKQKGMRQMIVPNGVFQRSGNVLLPYDCVKRLGPVFACGDDEFFHE